MKINNVFELNNTPCAAGGGGGGCYEEFRENVPQDLNQNIKNSEVVVSLLPLYRRGKYSYNYKIEIVGDIQEDNFFFVIPFSKDKVTDVWANDPKGGLAFTLKNDGTHKTRLDINFREKQKKGDIYSFSFGYETDVISIIKSGMFKTTVTYSDWFSHNNNCKHLKIKVNLPPKCKTFQTVPPADISHNPILFDIDNLRPLEYYSYIVAYSTNKLGKSFWIGTISLIVSAIIGASMEEIIKLFIK